MLPRSGFCQFCSHTGVFQIADRISGKVDGGAKKPEKNDNSSSELNQVCVPAGGWDSHQTSLARILTAWLNSSLIFFFWLLVERAWLGRVEHSIVVKENTRVHIYHLSAAVLGSGYYHFRKIYIYIYIDKS